MKYTKDQVKHYTDIIERLPIQAQGHARQIVAVNNPATVDKALNEYISTLDDVEQIPVQDIDIIQIENDIQGIINKTVLKLGLDTDTDLIRAPQRLFGAVCADIGKYIRPMLVSHESDTNINIDLIIRLVPVYYQLCDRYNKAVLYDHLAGFLGISRDYLSNIEDKLTSAGLSIAKKREASLTAGAIDTPVGTIAALNHLHGWTTNRTETTKQIETVVIYPKLVDIKKNQLSDHSEQ
jgi:hypothetical protein